MTPQTFLATHCLTGAILFGVMAHSQRFTAAIVKISQRLIETNDYNNRTLSLQAPCHDRLIRGALETDPSKAQPLRNKVVNTPLGWVQTLRLTALKATSHSP